MDDNRASQSKVIDVPGGVAVRPAASILMAPSGAQPRFREPQGGLGPRAAINALLLWWKVALPLGLLLAAGGGSAVWFSFQPKYAASAWVYIQDATPYLAFELRDDRGQSVKFVQTQIELMRSPIVLGPVVGKADVAQVPELARQEDRIAWLAKKLTIKAVGQSEYYTVSFECANPKDSALVVNAVVDAYFRQRDSDDSQQVQRVLKLLQDEKKRKQDEVEILRSNFRSMTQETMAKGPLAARVETDPFGQHPLTDLQKQIVTVEVEREVLQAQMQAIEETLEPATAARIRWILPVSISEETLEQPPVVPEEAIAKALESNPEIQRLRTAVLVGKANLEELRQTLTKAEKDKAFVALQTRIAEEEQTLERVRESVRKGVIAELERSVAGKKKDHLATLALDLKSRGSQEAALKKRFQEQLDSLKAGSGETVDLQFRRSELMQSEEVLNRLASRITQLRTEQAAPSRVTLRYKATAPEAPIEAFPYRNVALAALAGLGLPFGLAFLWERTVRRVSEPRDLQQESGLMVLGEVARLPLRRVRLHSPAPGRAQGQIQLFEESIDSLRTSLLLGEQLRDARVLAITSGVSREGKTSVAVSLAFSIARAMGQPTLLIDGDMRSPAAHDVFGANLGPGLAEVLRGECRADEAIVKDRNDSLHLLPAGKLTGSPHRLLGNGELRSLLQELAAQYRYIVIDTPPVLAAAESLVFAKNADACLVCAMRNVSRGDHVRKACERLATSGCRTIGAVLNGVPGSRYDYRGDYAYSRG